MNRRLRDEAQVFNQAWDERARSSRTGWDAEIADLVACAEQFCEAAVVEPTLEFRTSLRTQLLTEAATVLAPVDAPPRIHRPPVRTPSFALRRRLATATAALVTAGGFVGMVGASAQALPGEMLYPVKRSVENVELAFHKDDLSRGQYRLTQASERLAEARRLTDDSSPQAQEHVAGVLADFAVQAKDGSGALFRAYGHSGSVQSITVVNDFSAAAAADLAQLSGRVPSNANQAFQAAASTVSELVTKASTLCNSCGTANVAGLVDAVSSLRGGPSGTSPSTNPLDTKSSSPQEPVDKSELPELPKITVPNLPLGGQSPSPTTAGTSGTPKVKTLTDPVVGALLGDDEQEGVVPNLLDNLLKPKQ
ncbi:MAG: hypothetical protein QOF68_412 [Gaiellales bacterium]|jgi:hypothetical protein|nr:hypothetical protein [Gaiellales bacterium]